VVKEKRWQGFGGFQTKLQAIFLLLGLAAIGATLWEASSGAVAALRQTTFDRLTTIRQTRKQQIERYFQDLGGHVLALSNDESVLQAVEEFRGAWSTLLTVAADGMEGRGLAEYYKETESPMDWLPKDGRAIWLQHLFLSANPYPHGAKDRLLAADGSYGKLHSRYHPTLHRYQNAFGIYDIFLMDAAEGRVLYSVFKEVDLGARLKEAPYEDSGLADVYRRAMSLGEPEQFVVRDFERYGPSHFAPAAFLAAPIWRAGVKIGVLAIQVSSQEVNRLMTTDGNWEEGGLGRTGQAYIVGPDQLLRSDMRQRSSKETSILKVRVAPEAGRYSRATAGTETGVDLRGVAVLRSHAPLSVPGLEWAVVAEIEVEEAFAAVRALQFRILWVGGWIAALYLVLGTFVARSITRPLLELAEGAKRLGLREFGARLPVRSQDEIGQVAESFNEMAAALAKTTVSKAELEVLAGRLMTAQEDERRRIARDLHDDVTQRMAAIAIEAGRLAQLQGDEDLEWKQGMRQIQQQVARLSDDIHGLSRSLHPGVLDDLGLAAGIESECRAFFERGGAPVEVSIGGELEGLPKEVQLGIYRIVQEGLRNIQKHANAENVWVAIEPQGAELCLTIRDDGRGFDRRDAAWRAGLGLASMEERARLLGGRMEIHSKLGAGTEIVVYWPVSREAA